jgi:hypothetical protein
VLQFEIFVHCFLIFDVYVHKFRTLFVLRSIWYNASLKQTEEG